MQTLQSQLNILKQKQKTEPKLPYGSQSSLLFDFRYANKIELDTIYEIGYEGLLELTKKDESFGKYLKLLFSSTSKYFNRDMIPSDEIKEYDEHLKQLIYALSKHFNEKSAHQVIEYLIKVYHVNLHLCDEIIFSFLCYHSQPVFIKLLQNINFAENFNWSFIELYAKNGTLIPKSVIANYSNSDFAFLLRLISFYIDNIDITNEAYYLFVLGIIKDKISSMNSIKPIEANLFHLIIKLINMIHSSYSKIKIKKEEVYTLAYIDCMLCVLSKVNFSSEYLQAIANDSINKVLTVVESKNSLVGILTYYSLLCSKYSQLTNKSEIKLYKIESLKQIEKRALMIESISNHVLIERDIEYFIFQLIVSADDKFALVKSLLIAFFQEQSIIERVIVLLMKHNQLKQWSLIEDLNLALFNKAFIHLYNQGLISTVIQANKTNYGVYIDLISSSVAQVLKAIKECDEEIGMDIDDSIKAGLRSKFDFFADEVILNSIMRMKRVSLDDLDESLLKFYYNIKKERVTKYSDTLIQAIQNHLDQKQIKANQIYYLYRAVFFNNKDHVEGDKRKLVPIESVVNELIGVIEYQFECNKELNQKRTIAYIKEALSAEALTIEQCNSVQSLFYSKHLGMFYPQIASSLYHSYIVSINKSKVNLGDKLHLISNMVLYALNSPSQFGDEDITESLNIAFGIKIASHQLYLAYLLFEGKENNSNKVIEYVCNSIQAVKEREKEIEVECLLLISLMMHLSKMTNDQITFFFNPKAKMKIAFSSLDKMNVNQSPSSVHKGQPSSLASLSKDNYANSFNTLIASIFSNKNEIAINKNYLNRIFNSNAINHEQLYLLVLQLLLNQYNQCYHNASIQVLSLFTKSVSFSKDNQQYLLSTIDSVDNDPELESLLLKNFMRFYPQSQFEVMLYFKNKAIPHELLEVFFESGFPINEIKSPQILFQVISFAMNNNVSPYSLNISLPQDEVLQYLNYIIKHPIEESQLTYFFKMVMLMNRSGGSSSNAELIVKTIEILKATAKSNADININLCYALYSFSKQLIKAKAPNSPNDIIKSIASLFRALCDSVNISNIINYEQEKKMQLLLSASSHLCSLATIDNNILIDLAHYVHTSETLGVVLKKEIGSIILEAVVEFINMIKKQTPEFYFKYAKCVIQYSDSSSVFLRQLSQNEIIMSLHQCEAYFSYHLYEKYSDNERNEVLTGFILSHRRNRTMFEWMRLIEEVVNLKETKGKTVKELMRYIISFILKINKWNNNDNDNEAKVKDTCTVMINIITLLYRNDNDSIEHLLQFAKKNKLLSLLLIAIYSPNESLAINYSKAKNFILSKLTKLIPIESTDSHDDLLSFILKKVILPRKEKKTENLIYLYQLLTRISTKAISSELFKESLNQIIQMLALTTDTITPKTNIGHIVYVLSICKWLLTVFNLFTMSYLTTFNAFIPLFIKCFNDSASHSFNRDVRILIIDNMALLTREVCAYLSPFLNELIAELMQFEDIEETKEVLSKIGSKNIFDASFECVKANQAKLNSLLLIYFNSAIHSADGLIIADLGNDVMEYFITILLSHQKLFDEIKECIKSFILKIHGKQLKIIFSELLKTLKGKDEYHEYQFKTSIVIFQVFNTILSIIKDLFIKNYFIKYKDVAIQLLNTSNAFIFKKSTPNAPLKLGRKRERSSNAHANIDTDDSSNSDFTYYKLSCLLLENIKMNFRYSKGELLAETTEEFYEPVLNQLKLSDSMPEMLKYYEEAVKSCLYEMFKNSKSDELIGKFNEDLLELLREDNYVTRLLVLKTVLHLFETMKERYISFIEEIVQCVSERLEDSNELVRNAAREVIKAIEKLTGESYATYLE